VAGELPRVGEAHVEAVAPARRDLRGRERDPDARPAAPADDVEHRSPPATQVEDAPARTDPDLLGDEVVLAGLGLLEAEREVPVVLGAAEVGQLSQAESEQSVDQRVGELEVIAVSHVLTPGSKPRGAWCAPRAGPDRSEKRTSGAGLRASAAMAWSR